MNNWAFIPFMITRDGSPVIIKGMKANLFMNPNSRMYELGVIKRTIDEEYNHFKEDLEKGKIPDNLKKYNALYCYHKVISEMDQEKNIVGYTLIPLEDKIKKARAECGFFGSLMHRQEKTVAEALEDYKTRDEHEKNFHQMKNQMKFNIQRNSSEDGKEGRSLILFAGLIVISSLREIWRSSSEMQRTYDSTYDMLDEMESIRLSRYLSGSTHMTTFTGKQAEIAIASKAQIPPECLTPTARKEYERMLHPKKRGPKSGSADSKASGV